MKMSYYKNRENLIGKVKIYCLLSEDEMNVQQYIIEKSNRNKLWMIGTNQRFYETLADKINEEFSNLSFFYSFLDQMNDLISFPDRLEELERKDKSDQHSLINNSILREKVYNFWDFRYIYNCSKFLFSNSLINNFKYFNSYLFEIGNFKYIYHIINDPKTDPAKYINILENEKVIQIVDFINKIRKDVSVSANFFHNDEVVLG